MSKRYDKIYQFHRRFLKNICRALFIYEGNPGTIDFQAHEENLLFEGGFSVGFKTDAVKQTSLKNKPIISSGAISGVDVYYRPTLFTPANPNIVGVVKRTPGVDCSICYNTLNYRFPETVNPLIDIYADLLAHVMISTRTSAINSRVTLIPTVSDDKEAIRVSDLIAQMYDGESYALAYEISELDGKNIFPIKARDNIVVSELADARRNILADFFSQLGVKTLAVDKKERTNLTEMDSNSQQLKICCDIMLDPRKKWCEEMNRIFGLNLSVKFNESEVLKYVEPQSLEESDDNQRINA